MWKNITIGSKLVLIGSPLVLVPLAVVAFLAVTQTTAAFTASSIEQMASRVDELVLLVDTAIKSEGKMVVEVSVGNATIAGAKAVAERGITGSGKEIAPSTRSSPGS